MMKRIDVTQGDKFGDLTIIKEIERYKEKRYFLCRCSCGKERRVRFVALRAGRIKSCGCKRDERNRTANLSHGEAGSHLYNSWHSMKQRCLNPRSKVFIHYGGRGITVRPEWMEYESFRAWALANSYSPNLTIERKDVNGNYEPDNCTWIEAPKQLLNTRRTRRLTLDGKTQPLKLWADELGMSAKLIRNRIEDGWSIENALRTPIDVRFSHRKVIDGI